MYIVTVLMVCIYDVYLMCYYIFIQLEGTGSARLVQLQPRCTFAMDMAQLVSFHPEGLFISQLVPIYKITLGRELVVANLGYPKLITALESLSNILVVSISRVVQYAYRSQLV